MGLNKEETKEALKEALKDWLDEKFLQFGKWSVGAIATMVFGALIYFVLTAHGWQPPAPKLPTSIIH